MNKVKFSVFSDLHYDNFWIADGQQRLDFILQRAKDNKCDFIIHTGDFTSNPHDKKEQILKYNNFEIPTYHVLGNNDMECTDLNDLISIYNMPGEYYYFDKSGFRFIVLNTSYYRYEGVDVAYSKCNQIPYKPYCNYVSAIQLEWLEKTVMESPFPMVILSHVSLCEDENNYGLGDGLKNREDLQNIIRNAHKCGKRILLALSGHRHVDFMRIFEHVCYMDVNSASFHLIEHTHNLFPEEFLKAHEGACRLAIYNNPVHAIITLSDDGTIEIEGMKSSFFCGVTKGTVAQSNCYKGINCTPDVLSEKLILPMKL